MLQTLRRRLREIGRFKLIPRTLAFRAVQRQTAASTSASPWMRLQHGSTGGLPRVKSRRPLSTLAQTPSWSVSLGHFPMPELGLGLGVGFGFGLGEGQPPPQGVQLPHADIVVKKRRLKTKKRAMELEAMFCFEDTVH